jgi:hypothetical protein
MGSSRRRLQQSSAWMPDDGMPSLDTTEDNLQESVLPEQQYVPEQEEQNTTTAASGTVTVLSVILIAIASVVVTCAALLYISDVHDRCKYQMEWYDVQQEPEQQQTTKKRKKKRQPNESAWRTSARSQDERPWKGDCRKEKHHDIPPVLPPWKDEGEDIEEALFTVRGDRCASLSRMSSMTNSVAEEDDDDDEDVLIYDTPVMEATLELKEHHRIGTGTDLEAIVEMVLSRQEEDDDDDDQFERQSIATTTSTAVNIQSIIEMTPVTTTTSKMVVIDGDEKELIAVASKKEQHTMRLSELTLPPEHFVEERDATQSRQADSDHSMRAGADDNTVAQLLDVSANSENVNEVHDDAEVVEDYIREIYFVPFQPPTASPQSALLIDPTLGLDLHDASCPATHPCIRRVQDGSPLMDRVFEGDYILGINDTDTAGLTGLQMFELAAAIGTDARCRDLTAAAKMVKLTVMSSQCDDVESESTVNDGSRHLDGHTTATAHDLGCCLDSAMEV